MEIYRDLVEPENDPETGQLSVYPSAEADLKGDDDRRQGKTRESPIIFVDHTGKRYLLPWSQCQTWRDTQAFISSLYSRIEDSDVKNEILQGRYDMLDFQGNIILPELWSSIMEPGWTVLISLWSQPTPKVVVDSSGKVAGYTMAPKVPQGPPSVGRGEYDPPPVALPEPGGADDMPFNHISRPGSTSDNDSESVTLAEEQEDESLSPPPPPREVVTPIDKDGNRLSFLVDSRFLQTKQETTVSKSNSSREMRRDTLSISKFHMFTADSKTSLQLHTLSGPKTASNNENTEIRWHHLSAGELDFSQFKHECLSLSGLSDRLHRLISRLLDKVEKEKLRTFVDGMFIDPGTVVRFEERHREDEQAAIFSCVPFFDIFAPKKSTANRGNQLHPPRSLIQSYYPYEPVRERDMEQVFRKYNTIASNDIIQVPLLWMVNIGSHMVVTCSHNPLDYILGKSINVIPEEQPANASNAEASRTSVDFDCQISPTIRLTDWDTRTFLFTVEECKTYFELEQKLRELKLSARVQSKEKLEMAWRTQQSHGTVTPAKWMNIIRSQHSPFIDLFCENDKQDHEGSAEEKTPVLGYSVGALTNGELKSPDLLEQVIDTPASIAYSEVVPFFMWPRAKPEENPQKNSITDTSKPQGTTKATVELTSKHDVTEALQYKGSIPDDKMQMLQCLVHVEKALMTETLTLDDTAHAVEKAFTSTSYYESLPELTIQRLREDYSFLRHPRFGNLLKSYNQKLPTNSEGIAPTPGSTRHEIIFELQLSKLTAIVSDLIVIVECVIRLFLPNANKSTMLRRVWGAMKQIADSIDKARQEGPLRNDDAEYTDSNWKSPLTGNRRWIVRNVTNSLEKGRFTVPPESEALKASISECVNCRGNKIYSDPNSAIEHLRQEHLPTLPDEDGTQLDHRNVVLANWIRNDGQMLIEERNAAYLTILCEGVVQAEQLLSDTAQLANGVAIGVDEMSDRYDFPPVLLESFRRIVVFFLAIERSVFFTDECFQKREASMEDPPFSKQGLQVLQRFSAKAQSSLFDARRDLCVMVRSDPADDALMRLSLGPEFVLAWLMRRLLVKPVTESMRVADIYREYLFRIQFQVNHRPSKRLLRDINLLQEELIALDKVNDWQVRVVENYVLVLDDATYQKDIPKRRALFPIEHTLLNSCLVSLSDNHQDYTELLERCQPLSETAKQSTEINEEDHGKAILIFTIVTIVFLPLSFVTSYLGMNTSDIRNMNNKQSLFWEIAIPLTVVTLGSILFVAYNGDEIRDRATAIGHTLMGKQTTQSSRSLGVAQRKRLATANTNSSGSLDYKSVTDQAEFLTPAERPSNPFSVIPSPTPAAMDTNMQWGKKAGRPIQKRSNFRHTEAIAYADMTPYDSGMTRSRYRTTSGPDVRHGAFGAGPDYPRFHKHYVSPDALAYYNLPWEYDPSDPNFLIVLRTEDQMHDDGLWEDDLAQHTRKLRGQPEHRTRMRYQRDRPDYAFVKKKEHTRRKREKSNNVMKLF